MAFKLPKLNLEQKKTNNSLHQKDVEIIAILIIKKKYDGLN